MRFNLVESVTTEYDSDGNLLSPEQVEYFKNSKVRDSQGRLLVCYHGTDEDFSEFNHSFISDDNKLGFGFYFTLGQKLKYSYSHPKAVYLNIESPLITKEANDELVDKEWELKSKGLSKKEVLLEISRLYGIDGVIESDTMAIAFNSNQIKSITNKKPTSQNNINEDTIYTKLVGKVDGDNIFDINFADGYNDELKHPDYYANKNISVRIVYMTPLEYFKECSKIFGNTVEHNIRQVKSDSDTINELRDVILVEKEQFPITTLDYVNNSQEGRHRMYVASQLFGWNHKFPVLIIDYIDKDKAVATKQKEKEDAIRLQIKNAVESTIKYHYNDIEEFKEELALHIDDEFYENNTKFDLAEQGDKISVTVKGVTYSFDASEIKYNDSQDLNLGTDNINDLDWDDLDYELLKDIVEN